MPVVRPADATEFQTHGSRFLSYVSPSKGSTQLCAWRLTVPASSLGVAHRPDREEVVLVLDGELHVTLDGATSALTRGDAVLVPAGSELRVDGGPVGATAWVSTTPGLQATMADGTQIQPPWAR